ASWRALFTSSVSMVRRTWVSGLVSRSHPAKIVPANPVGIWPCTRRDIRTVTSMCGDGSMTRGRIRIRAATPPGAGYVTRRAGALQQDAAAALPDRHRGLRRMHLRAVREVGVGAGLTVRTVTVDDALLRRRCGAVPGRRPGVSAVEDPASHRDHPIAGARP